MEWKQISIFTTTFGVDIVCDRLTDAGFSGFEIEDEKDFNEFLEHNTKYWDFVDEDLVKSKQGETCVKLYAEADNALKCKLLTIADCMKALKGEDTDGSLGSLRIETASVMEEDWANNWKQYFKPTEVGDKILICPEWEEMPPSHRKVFKVNPGLTFGTGTHHSTRMCIEHLEKIVGEGTTLIDIGCGSGILSIISLILGAKSATAVDIDENCVHVAYENLEMNGISADRYRVLSGDILTDEDLFNEISTLRYDVVVANIVADVIIALLPIAEKLTKDNGFFVCSGIIDERLPDVEKALRDSRFEIDRIVHSGGWSSVLCKLIEKS